MHQAGYTRLDVELLYSRVDSYSKIEYKIAVLFNNACVKQ